MHVLIRWLEGNMGLQVLLLVYTKVSLDWTVASCILC